MHMRAGAEAHPLNSSWLLALLPYLPLLKWQRRDLVHEGATKLRRMKKTHKNASTSYTHICAMIRAVVHTPATGRAETPRTPRVRTEINSEYAHR